MSARVAGWLLFAVFAFAVPFPAVGPFGGFAPAVHHVALFAATGAIAVVEGTAGPVLQILGLFAVHALRRSRYAGSRPGCSRACSRVCRCARGRCCRRDVRGAARGGDRVPALRDAVRPRAHREPVRGVRLRAAALGALLAAAAIAAASAARAAVRAHRIARSVRTLRSAAPAVLRRYPRAHGVLVRRMGSGHARRAARRLSLRARRGDRHPALRCRRDARRRRSSCAVRSTSRSSPITAICSARPRSARTPRSRATTRSCVAWSGGFPSSATRS